MRQSSLHDERPGLHTIRALALAMMLAASSATAGEAGRSGFTAESGLGIGLTRLPSGQTGYGSGADDLLQWGWGGLAIGLGGFVNEKTAIMLRLTGTSFQFKRDGATYADSAGGVITVPERRDA